MSTLGTVRTDTTMGRALAARALHVAETTSKWESVPQPGVLDLTQPQPLLNPPHVRQAAREALQRGETHYTVRPGIPELRSAIADRLIEDGFPATVDSTVVTNGGAEALYIVLQSALTPGDRALIVGPAAPNILEMIQFIGADVQRAYPQAFTDYRSVLSQIETADASVVILASPSLITGKIIPVKDLERLVSAAIERNMTVVLDRSAVGCLYDPALSKFPNSELGSQAMVIGSFSDSHALHGWRVGYFNAPEDRIAKLRGLKQAMSICTTAVSQYAALAALEGPGSWESGRRAMFQSRRDAVTAALTEAGLNVVRPDAYPGLLVDVSAIDSQDRNVATRLERDAGVIVEPGSAFGESTQGYIWINLSAAEQDLQAGSDRIAELR